MKKSFLILSLIFWASSAYGHGAGQTLSSQVGEYTIDIDYDSSEVEIDANQPIRFTFILWNKDRTEPIEFTGVWVKVTPIEKFSPIFTGQLGIPEFGGAGMSVVFPKNGTYELTARFINKDKNLAESTYNLTVVGEDGSDGLKYKIAMFVGVVLGITMGFFFFRKRAELSVKNK